jgi:aryl-alcohol dehydrogenase-like predicted oxidoreductase
MSTLRKLGRSDIEVTPIGLGCWQFSEARGMAGRFWPALSTEETNAIVEAALAGGINWFDTAEAYGGGRSEAALARALRAAGREPGDVIVATKWMPTFRRASSIGNTIGERLKRLDGFPIDLHQVHHWSSVSSVKAQMDAMADLVEAKRIRAVGVSNFSARRMRKAHAALAKRGVPLVANQVHYSLLKRDIERTGVMEAAKALGITIIAYSPLAQGLLTGKYHDDPELIRDRPGPRKWFPSFRRHGLARTRPLIDELRAIAAAHDATAAQVALNWLVTFHGDTVVAIPGATRVENAEACAAATGFELTENERAQIDEISRAVR